MDTFIQTLLGSSLLMICLLLFFTVLFHATFIWFPAQKKSPTFWKVIDYIWLGLAALGIITACQNVRVVLAETHLQNTQTQAEFAYKNFRYLVGDEEAPPYICREFKRSPFSPENFDEIVKEYDQFCVWNKLWIASLPERVAPDYPEINIPPSYQDPPDKRYMEHIHEALGKYQELRNRIELYETASQSSDFEQLLFFFWPFLLCIALALRITKVTGN